MNVETIAGYLGAALGTVLVIALFGAVVYGGIKLVERVTGKELREGELVDRDEPEERTETKAALIVVTALVIILGAALGYWVWKGEFVTGSEREAARSVSKCMFKEGYELVGDNEYRLTRTEPKQSVELAWKKCWAWARSRLLPPFPAPRPEGTGQR